MSLKFSKVRDVKSPTRANPTDAGIDWFVPREMPAEDFEAKNKNWNAYVMSTKIVLLPHGRACIPAGIHVNLDEGMALIAANKSGVATKKGLIFGAQVIDSDYQGEVHISVINTTSDNVEIPLGSKIIQFLYMPVSLDMPTETPFDELYTEETSRGAGGFGSSGDK